MGINQGMKELAYNTSLFICGRCGRYGRYQMYMTYMCLSLFFIPTLKWNRRYYVKTSCCGTVYEASADIGKRIARGEEITITEDMLTLVSAGNAVPAWQPMKRCAFCGYETKEDFDFCPRCGQRLG